MGNDIRTPLPFVSTRNNEVDLLDPKPETIDMSEIALSLSRTMRYSGHTDEAMSVLRHVGIGDLYLVDVLRVEDPEYRLAWILHDAAEAYTGDITRPLKMALNKASDGLISVIEQNLETAILKRYGLPVDLFVRYKKEVKTVDNIALSTEVRLVWPRIIAEERWNGLPDVSRTFMEQCAERVLPLSDAELIWRFMDTVGYLLNKVRQTTAAPTIH